MLARFWRKHRETFTDCSTAHNVFSFFRFVSLSPLSFVCFLLYSAGKPCIPIDFSQRYYIMDFASSKTKYNNALLHWDCFSSPVGPKVFVCVPLVWL